MGRRNGTCAGERSNRRFTNRYMRGRKRHCRWIPVRCPRKTTISHKAEGASGPLMACKDRLEAVAQRSLPRGVDPADVNGPDLRKSKRGSGRGRLRHCTGGCPSLPIAPCLLNGEATRLHLGGNHRGSDFSGSEATGGPLFVLAVRGRRIRPLCSRRRPTGRKDAGFWPWGPEYGA